MLLPIPQRKVESSHQHHRPDRVLMTLHLSTTSSTSDVLVCTSKTCDYNKHIVSNRWPSLDGAWRQNFFAAVTMLPDCSLLL